jgi:gliding motility-associated-like protein
MYYNWLSATGSGNTYRITLKLFVRCDATTAQIDPDVNIAVYDGNGNYFDVLERIPRDDLEKYTATDVDPCIVNPPYVCYQIAYYTTQVTLPFNTTGYYATFQRCCRRTQLTNIFSDDNNVGGSYFTKIPGAQNNFASNSGPRFSSEKGTIVCANSKFRYDYAATDPNGDSLVYSFSTAYTGGDRNSPKPEVSAAPPFDPVSYKDPFTAAQPLGDKATIDPKTGVISGTAPRSGLYIVTVSVHEYRKGVFIGEHKKEFQFTVENCVRQVVAALPDKFADCDGYVINFVNNSTPNKIYVWDFGDGNTHTTNSLATFPHTYADTGTYVVKLTVDPASNCGDSAFSTVKVYPVLAPSFDLNGLCTTKPTQFANTSTTDVGVFDYFKWDFGDPALTNDTSNHQSPTWQYTTPGNYTVKFYMSTSKGCEKEVTRTINIYDKPPFTATGDTLLCIKDPLQLHAESAMAGSFSWAPLYNITGANTADPVVSPKKDTAYNVTFTDLTGCVNTKRVAIDVRDTIYVKTSADSVLCTGDPVDLVAEADGNYSFTWTNIDTRQIISRTNTVTVTPVRTGAYFVQVDLGSCNSRDSVFFRTVDPPAAFAGIDSTICYGDKVLLQASGGAFYSWSPPGTLTSPNKPATIAWPKETTTYVVTVTDTLGCPKPVTAERTITVVPPVPAFAGNDTIVLKGQPFRLNASGGVQYRWSPADGLSSTTVPDPVTSYNRDITYRVKVYTAEGCVGEDDINIRFMTGPEIYIPNAFTPNGDGVNDVFRPMPVGFTKMEYFRIYNRWGEEIYNSVQYLKGWDGRKKGDPAAADTYVWIVGGTNIEGQLVEKRGTVTLIR